MNFLRKVSIVILVMISIIGYGMFAFAVGPFAPGTELDPACSPYINNDPLQGVDTDCVVIQLSEIERGAGAPGSNPTGSDAIVYINESNGDVYSWDGVQWNVLGGSSGPVALGSFGDTLYTPSLGAGEGDTIAFGNNIILGADAGSGADNAYGVVMLGSQSGFGATSASETNFFGINSGYQAENAFRSNFFGSNSGYQATNATLSNFLGGNAGSGATGAYNSNFMGYNAGRDAIDSYDSNFLGYEAGFGATNASDSNFFGNNAGQNADNSIHSNFLGNNAGRAATNASYSNFMGAQAGTQATAASYSNFFGNLAGNQAAAASNSNFFGSGSGQVATNASNSNFLGQQTGYLATNAAQSNMLGAFAGWQATEASNSNFFGYLAGFGATNASHSFFVGENSGRHVSMTGTPNAANSIFIGRDAGYTLADNGLDNTTNPNDFSILIGNYTSTGGFSNSIALGQQAINTATNQFMIGSLTRPINDMTIIGAGFTTCTVDTGTGSGISCSSDERLKTNIRDLGNTTLHKLSSLRPVTYNWKDRESSTMIGFLAQNVQEYFPQLVSEGATGYLSVNYAGMAPILTKAIQELDLKLSVIESQVINEGGFSLGSLVNELRNLLGDVGNGIQKIFAREIETERLCVKKSDGTSVCVTGDQLEQALGGQVSGGNTSGGAPELEDLDNNDSANTEDESEDGSQYEIVIDNQEEEISPEIVEETVQEDGQDDTQEVQVSSNDAESEVLEEGINE